MPQKDILSILPDPDISALDPDIQKYFKICEEKLGLIPNVLQVYAYKPNRLRKFMDMYNEIMLEESGLSKLEREMIAVVVSSCNRCYYCLVAHGQAVRQLSGDPELGEMMVMNYRIAPLSDRHKAMLDFAWKLTETPGIFEEEDRQKLRDAGFNESDYFDICETVSFFNYTNRMAHATEMMPNKEYHSLDR
ncbi:peroxidase-related enzyme [Curvivirga sp.]|uniref:peroxidase-related enzyme n=1 Tax=Curvivirga sp. TaxID=2856848 RepID=UPI003B5A013A